MLKRVLKLFIAAMALIAMAVPASHDAMALQAGPTNMRVSGGAQQEGGLTQTQVSIAEEARHQLVTLPYYGVFDWLDGEVRSNGTVVLRGQVVRPTTKSDAEARIRKIAGVTRVENQIEVLPLSPEDDRLRLAVYRAIYNFDSPLFRYATMAVPPIHIIIRNGRATLKGVVANKADRDIAYTKTSSVPGLFAVTNDLTIENQTPR